MAVKAEKEETMAWRRFDRDRYNGAAGEEPVEGNVATRTRDPHTPAPPDPEDRIAPGRDPEDRVTRRRGEPVEDRVATRHAARERFGGLNWGAAFFGWLTALGMAAILTALLSAAGAAIGISEGSAATAAEDNAETVSIVGGALLLVVLAIAYFCGGYVAGRMSRFDGKRQGLGVWAIGFLITLTIAAVAAIAGSEWNVLNQLNLPRIPIDEGDLATGGAIALALGLLTTLIASVLGGAKGRHYHDRVDRAGVRDW
jgi:hypothetical protein